MAELVTLARPYANAAFAVARQDERLAEWSRTLQLLAALTQADEVQHLLNSPDQSAADKVAMLVRLCGEEADDKVERLLQELARNKRLTLLPAISEQFEALRATAEAVLDVEIVSAYELTEAQQQNLADNLKRRFDRDVRLSSRIDNTLLGGVMIKAGDMVIDGTVRGRLQKLTETLQRS